MFNQLHILATAIYSERVLSKIGIGEFNNHFSTTNQVITAGNKNYIQRQGQLNQGLTDYYLQLQIPPGNPTQPNLLGQPESTGNPLPTVTGDYSIPRGWPQAPYFNPPGGPPGPPAQWSEPITNDNVTAGYGYLSNGLEERDLYFYHPDHLGSTSIITDRNGVATQFVAYMPFGESFVDEHTSSWESAYKFNGKELDAETGLYYYGARYYDPKAGIWFGVDMLTEKYPNVGGMVYCLQNPVKLVDPDGNIPWYAAVANFSSTATVNPPTASRVHPVTGTVRAHHGIDMAASTGTSINSVASGTVLFAGEKKGYGNTVVINHGDGYYTLYAHMNTIGVTQGESVSNEQLIGEVGNTGVGSGAHLHMEYIKTDNETNIFGGDKNSARFNPMDVNDLQNIINNTERANVQFLDGHTEQIGGYTLPPQPTINQADPQKLSQKLKEQKMPIIKTVGDILQALGL